MALTAQAKPPLVRGQLKVRQNVSELSVDDLNRYRAAVKGLMDRRDNLGYQWFAGWHGVPFGLCKHLDPYFPPWHRAYLYHFELALQRIDDSVTVPWWDWMNEPGIPAAFQEGGGNVLAGAPIEPYGVAPRPGWPTETVRNPGFDPPGPDPAPLAPPYNQYDLPGDLNYEEWILSAPSYTEFQRRLEALHGTVHVWTGGTMRDPEWAAYDPIFWSHHAQVDRLWRVWQHHHGGANPPAAILDRAMSIPQEPVFTPREVLDVKELGYEYAGFTSSTPGTL